jgi:hypothetical protein
MIVEKALFICNEKFLDSSFPEGGVKFCTDEYLDLLKVKFDVIYFPLKYSTSFGYKLSKKVGMSAYNDYETGTYEKDLKKLIKEHNIEYIFLNLTNTAVFAKCIKEIDNNIKVILCSHGNESGDYLHDIVKHKKFSGIKSILSKYIIGKMLAKESETRKHIDLVLTVSDVEVGIEKWLGASQVFMVPRYIDKMQMPYIPILGRVGFFSDLSHEPNFFGISEVCKSVDQNNIRDIEIHLAGGGSQRGKYLEKKYSFVKYLGYLSNEMLNEETASWTFALNPVFYYSRGVSTKLGKSLGNGMPVITSEIGLRGYVWKEGQLPTCKNANEMAILVNEISKKMDEIYKYKNEVIKIQNSSPSYESQMEEVIKILS